MVTERRPIRLTKMHGLGNNYLFLDGLAEPVPPDDDLPALARAVSDRNFGIGSDGLILVLPPRDPGARFRMRIFNADGSEGEMCGNGIRCLARLVYDRGYTRETEFVVETGAGPIRPRLHLDGHRVTGVTVDMGVPRLERGMIPMAGPAGEQAVEVPLEVEAGGERSVFTVTALSMGNPHCVVFVDDLEAVDLERLGPAFEHHPAFPQRVNTHFTRVLNPERVRVRVWERGSGPTLACGTGACAVAVAGALTGRTGRRVTVELPGGSLEVEWAGDGHVYMTGPAAYIGDVVYDPH
ncbi:diaminopimelate epimerase [Thermaerobacter subterraneus]|uniref:Diaminopimelate epimerase n=1 Tax=Thermaerobacter subterraneus DSM 13965 TaxID=867903 RepID=K6PYD2_9FIRM|nr:diaminopimelate epimerase [Thermaerobacter subterraneus DSM 13965]